MGSVQMLEACRSAGGWLLDRCGRRSLGCGMGKLVMAMAYPAAWGASEWRPSRAAQSMKGLGSGRDFLSTASCCPTSTTTAASVWTDVFPWVAGTGRSLPVSESAAAD